MILRGLTGMLNVGLLPRMFCPSISNSTVPKTPIPGLPKTSIDMKINIVAAVGISIIYLLFGDWPFTYAVTRHTDFVLNGFRSENLTLIKDAFIDSSRVLRLTNDSAHSLGRALHPHPLHIVKYTNNTSNSLSTTFIFSIVPAEGRSTSGHGIAFVLTPFKDLNGAIGAQFLGLLNLTTNGSPDNHLFAVEFDTAENEEFKDINGNHVGVDLNSLISVNSTTAGYWIDNGKKFKELNLKSGENIQAWIDYDGIRKQLNVSISPPGSHRPLRPLLSLDINLHDLFQEEMYVGFSASTGRRVESNYVLAWSLNDNGEARPLDISNLPSFDSGHDKRSMFKSRRVVGAICGASVIILLAVIAVAVVWVKRRKYRELIEEWELEFWPHRFSYRELTAATKGFRQEEMLGSGGFGRVYKGTLPSNGQEVAVKCVSHDSKQGLREFIAEISSMGRLQHRNLVPLRGWCKKHKELLLVYDYMPNGSLDKLIFDQKPEASLAWVQRYKILKGVAAGLLYLHEGWEQRVLHRDIKASNVLLDAEMNGRLGDFGLARLYDHGIHPRTTHVVGTLGYVAPEYVHTGKATPCTDVFSFGALLLEVASGRRPIEPQRTAEELVLVDWVLELCQNGKVLKGADPKLSGQFVAEEMELVLKLGLLCSHAEPEARPTMRQVVQILEDKELGHGFVLVTSMPPLVPGALKRDRADSHDYGDIRTYIGASSSSIPSRSDVPNSAAFSIDSYFSGRS